VLNQVTVSSSNCVSIEPVASETAIVTVVGKESVGKSQLIGALTSTFPSVENLRGSTVSVRRYHGNDMILVDTPGILRQSDTETTSLALESLSESSTVLLVVNATHLDDDLAHMLPLVQGKRGAIAVTFWDKIQPGEASMEAIERLSREAEVSMIPVDARSLTEVQRARLRDAMLHPSHFTKASLVKRAGWRIEPKTGILDHRVVGPMLAVLLLILPAVLTIYGANRFADSMHGPVSAMMEPVVQWVNTSLPQWLRIVLTSTQGEFGYGLLNMGPFLLVWALPTVLLFSVILSVYKASGLIERINVSLHPFVRPVGLSGRDLVRVMMGFGCNVPAVISTRACSGCSRGTAISAISFGSACSYQLPATLAVIATTAASSGGNVQMMTLAFLAYLLVTTLIYLRLTSPAAARSSLNVLMTPSRPFLQWPTFRALCRNAWETIRQFLLQAMPIFVVICVVASLLAHFGILDLCARVLGPVMQAFNLPAESSLPVILASIRKDGIFLFAADGGSAATLSPIQVLTAVYLAGVLLPCLVTALTIAKETSWRSTMRMLVRQASFAIGFSLILAWGGRWLIG
jgi:ferrous iron transport protein B